VMLGHNMPINCRRFLAYFPYLRRKKRCQFLTANKHDDLYNNEIDVGCAFFSRIFSDKCEQMFKNVHNSYIEYPVSLYQYFKVLILRPFPIRNGADSQLLQRHGI